MKRFKVSALLAMLIALLMLMSACTQPAKPAPPADDKPPADVTPGPVRENEERYGGDFIVATSYVSNTLDPHYSAGLMANYQWMMYVYETALIMGADGVVYPMLCDYEYADDGLSLKLTVKDYYFSDGSKLTIDDVVASFERAGKLGGSFATKVMDHVIDTKVVGDSVTYTFDKMSVTMLQEISDMRGPGYIMQKSVIDKLGEGNQITDPADVIGTGCYTLQSYSPDTKVVLKRNDNYVAQGFGGNGPAGPHYAYADNIIFSLNTDSASRTAGMIAGDYSIGSIMSEMQPYADQIGLKRRLLENQWTHAIFFNLSDDNKDSIVQNVDFRRAVLAAIDCDAVMMSVMNGDTERYYLEPSAITDKNTSYYNEILKNGGYNSGNKELAKQYLEASGYDGKEEITWLASEGSAFYRAAVVAIPMLEDIGIKVNLWVVDGGSHGGLRNTSSAGHDIGAWETQKAIANPLEQNNLVLGRAGGWWVNDRKTELINIMETTKTGSPESIKAYEDFCTLVTEEVPYVMFGTGRTLTYTQPNVELNYEGIIAYYWNSYFTD